MEMIDLAISVLPVDAGPQHVKLLLEWNEPDEFFCDTSDAFVEHESVSQLQVITNNHIEIHDKNTNCQFQFRIKSKAIQHSHWNNVWSIIQKPKR